MSNNNCKDAATCASLMGGTSKPAADAPLSGRIHSFESFGTVDGPGIRFIVFMQGCPLRCLYCHNPDTWDPLTKEAKRMTVPQVMQRLMAVRSFCKGGITVSGGEPLMQAKFIAELFKECHKLGIHTTVDSSGFYLNKHVINTLEETDLVLLDVKAPNEELHKYVTSTPLAKTLRFAEYLMEHNIPMWIRHVLIPDITDPPEVVRETARLIKTFRGVERIELLPYHTLGVSKWEMLKRPYPLDGVPDLSKESYARAKEIFAEEGVPVA